MMGVVGGDAGVLPQARLDLGESIVGDRPFPMSRIHRLPPDLANQIAAGEVVERPASVVKELVENALDAGARRIAVAVELGGKKLIRVEDDGEGMEPEDARLAIERHATSKIARADDLGAIRTLGFRGEALPSIASVSHFVLRTRARGAASGTEIRVNGGAIASVREVGAPEGTSIEVADLFYNLPARRKFLKSDTAETTQISRLVDADGARLSGGRIHADERRPDAAAVSAGRRACASGSFSCSASGPIWSRSARRRAACTIRATWRRSATRGRCAAPQNVFVNRRIVKDRTIAHAIIEAYSVATIKERSPEVHLFLAIAARPRRRERPSDEGGSAVPRAVAGARGAAPRARRALGQGRAPELQLPPVQPFAVDRAAADDDPRRARRRDRSATDGGTAANRRVRIALPTASPIRCRRRGRDDRLRQRRATRRRSTIRPMIPLGQFRDTFIIAVDDEGVAIIDQHVAHERVLFEQVMERLTTGRLESQRLLTPMLAGAVAGAASGAAAARARRWSGSAWRSRSSAATASGCRRCRRCSMPAEVRGGGARARRGSRRARSRRAASRTRCAGSPRRWRAMPR